MGIFYFRGELIFNMFHKFTAYSKSYLKTNSL